MSERLRTETFLLKAQTYPKFFKLLQSHWFTFTRFPWRQRFLWCGLSADGLIRFLQLPRPIGPISCCDSLVTCAPWRRPMFFSLRWEGAVKGWSMGDYGENNKKEFTCCNSGLRREPQATHIKQDTDAFILCSNRILRLSLLCAAFASFFIL